MKSPAYNIGDRVYHTTEGSPRGVVIDCRYSLRYNEWEYIVSFEFGRESLTYYEDELSFEKTVI